MADDDTKGSAENKPEVAKTPVSEAARARTKTARTAASKPAGASQPLSPNTATNSNAKPEARGAPDANRETDASAKEAEARPASGPRLPQSTGALAVLFAILILGVILFAWPGGRAFVANLFGGPPPAELRALMERVGTLEAKVAGLDRDIASLTAGEEARAALDKRLSALEARPGGEVPGPRLEALEKRLAELSAKVAAQEARLGKAEGADPSATMAAMALAGSLRAGGPFAGLAARVAGETGEAGPVAKGLDALRSYAAKGVPTVAALAARLETLPVPTLKEAAAAKPAAPAAPEKPAQPTGFWDKVKTNVLKLGRIRKTPEKPTVPDITVSARAAAAEALVRGDLAAAGEAAKDLAGPEAEAWRRDLGARIQAERLAATLDQVVAARLGRGPAKP
jgi:hypothetical protein